MMLRPPLLALGLKGPAELSVLVLWLLVLVAVPPVVAAAVPPELPDEVAERFLLVVLLERLVFPLTLVAVLWSLALGLFGPAVLVTPTLIVPWRLTAVPAPDELAPPAVLAAVALPEPSPFADWLAPVEFAPEPPDPMPVRVEVPLMLVPAPRLAPPLIVEVPELLTVF